MTEIINARFHAGGKEYSFNPNGLKVEPGMGLILPTPKGPAYGVCTAGNHMVEETTLVAPLRPVIRLATEEETAQAQESQEAAPPRRGNGPREERATVTADPKTRDGERERQAKIICRKKIAEHGLDMKLVAAECVRDSGKIVFYFTSENRVDFRALVKDLAGVLRCRIELRQIGVRDETKVLGGIGICGQPYCCSRYLDRFQPVSIKMAKTQNLSLNPTKISGSCGRLMCCLKHEQAAYEDAVKRCPKKDSFVETPDGPGNIVEVNYLREKVKVRLEEEGAGTREYYIQEIRVVRSGKGKRPEDYVAPPREELEALRYIPPEEEGKPRPAAKGSLAAALEEIFAEDPTRSAVRKPSRAGGRSRRGGAGQRKEPQQPQPKKAAQPAQGGGQPKAKNNNHHHRRRRPQGPKSEG